MCVVCGKTHPLVDDEGNFEEQVEEAELEDCSAPDLDDTQEIPEYIRELYAEVDMALATMDESSTLDKETEDLLKGGSEEPEDTPP